MSTEEVNQEQTESEIDAVIERAKNQVMAEIAGANPTPDTKPDESDGAIVDETAKQEPETTEIAVPTMEERFQNLARENQTLQRKIDAIHGTYGNTLQKLNAKIEVLEKPSDSRSDSRLEQILSTMDINDPEFEEMKKEFPGVGEIFLDGFKRKVTGSKSEADQPVIEQKQEQPQEQRQQQPQIQHQPTQAPQSIAPADTPDQSTYKLALKELQREHKDFEQIAGFDMTEIAPGVNTIQWQNPDFGKWVQAQPDNIRDLIINGGTLEKPTPEIVLGVMDVLTAYKSAHQQSDQSAGHSDSRATVTNIKPKPDLSKSLLPSGRNQSGKVTLTEDELIEEAKNRTMKQIMTGGE